MRILLCRKRELAGWMDIYEFNLNSYSKLNVKTIYICNMQKDTPEYFYKQIQEVKTALDEDETDENYKKYYDDLAGIRKNIQTQIDKIITKKPVKSQQLLEDYKEIYNMTYMTNFSLFLGICLILWYIFKANSNTPNVATSNTSP